MEGGESEIWQLWEIDSTEELFLHALFYPTKHVAALLPTKKKFSHYHLLLTSHFSRGDDDDVISLRTILFLSVDF